MKTALIILIIFITVTVCDDIAPLNLLSDFSNQYVNLLSSRIDINKLHNYKFNSHPWSKDLYDGERVMLRSDVDHYMIVTLLMCLEPKSEIIVYYNTQFPDCKCSNSKIFRKEDMCPIINDLYLGPDHLDKYIIWDNLYPYCKLYCKINITIEMLLTTFAIGTCRPRIQDWVDDMKKYRDY